MIQVPSCFDYVEWDLFDTNRIDRKGLYRFFNKPLSLEKDDTKTNMEMYGMLPPPQEFTINSLLVLADRVWHPDLVTVANEVWNNSSVELWIGQKIVFNTVLSRFPMDGDYKQMWDTEKKKWILPRPVHFSKHKPHISMERFFTVLLKTSVSDSIFDYNKYCNVKVILSGELRRPVN